MSKKISYKELSSGEMVLELGTDANKWADAFMEIVVDGGLEIDQHLMMGWFANAIVHAEDIARHGKGILLARLQSELAEKQEPLGEEFEKVLHENLSELMEVEPTND